MPYNKVCGLLIDCTYVVNEKGFAVIQLFVSTENAIVKISDSGFSPYFYVLSKDVKTTISSLESHTFQDGIKILKAENAPKENAPNAIRVHFKNPQELVKAREEIGNIEGVTEKREYDIPFADRYIIDNSLKPMQGVEIEHENFEVRKITPVEIHREPRMVALDLETYSPGRFSDPAKDPILMAVLYKNNGSVVYTYKPAQKKDVVVLKNEKELVEKMLADIREYKPDILVTYNGDGFDMPYIKERCERLQINCDFGFGAVRLINKGMFKSAELRGTQHLDAFVLIKFMARIGAVSLLKFDLENVAEKLFGKPKEKLPAAKINELWDAGELDRIIDYNREDGEVTLRLAREFLPLQLQLCYMLGQTLSETSRMTSSQMVEQLLLTKSFQLERLSPNRPSEAESHQRTLQTFEGGFVKEPLAGLHENIAVLDFRSLHPTIMIAHNISPETLKCEHPECRSGKNLSPDKDWFCERRKGFLAGILEEILAERIKLKHAAKKMDKADPDYKMVNARQHALKILLNSHYGYLGYARARWYSRESARAVTAWSRHYIQNVMKGAERENFKVVYGDSVTKDRIIVLKGQNNMIYLQSVEEFYNSTDRLPSLQHGKEAKPVNGVKTLSVNPKTLEPEWKNVKTIIRHKTEKKIYRVAQKFGETIVTQDHSILVNRGDVLTGIKPTELGNDKFFSADIPKEESDLNVVDLFEQLKNYTFDIFYKERIKINQFHADDEWIWFGWMDKKETVKMKRHIRIGSTEFEALCRLLGAYIAEGSSSTYETTSTKIGASIASSNKEWLEKLQIDYLSLFSNVKTSIIRSGPNERTLTYSNGATTKTVQYTDNTMKLQMMNALSAVVFKLLCGQKSTGKKLPDFIFNVHEKYKKILLEKMIEGDGSHAVNYRLGYSHDYIRNNFSYTTKSLKVASGMSLLLNQIGQKHTIYYRKSKMAYSIKTCSRFNQRMETKITEEKYAGFVYDLSVEENNNFVDACGRILLHNTDSMFLILPNEKNEQDVKSFLEKTNSKLPESMELELDGLYRRGIFVTKESGGAAKKRYALMDYKGNLKIVGFEYVRHDWAPIAKNTQRSVIEAVLKEGNPMKAVQITRDVIRELKSGKVPKRELVIMKQLKARPENYESAGPHVWAAKKAMARGKAVDVGTLIPFIVTKGSSKKISDKAEMEEYVKEGDYDSDYYIENQILQAVLKITKELGYDREDLLQGGKQSTLFSFK